jgi:NADP-reducing hydrogenase subunit HndD
MVNLKINGIAVQAEEGMTIMEAARLANVDIPSLCYLKDINCIGACRICVVEVKGARSLVASCVYPVSEGLEVWTNTPAVRKSRKTTLELLLSEHNKKCLSCVRSNGCELQRLAKEYGVDEDAFPQGEAIHTLDTSSPFLVRDNNKCIACMRCVAACNNQSIAVIGPRQRGHKKTIGCAFEVKLMDTSCVGCGQCVISCPVGALYEKSNVSAVWDAIADESKKVVFFTAPAIRATLGEEFGYPIGTNVEGKLPAAIRALGADAAFDMDVTADLTILEEAYELIDRIKTGKPLPMFTSCCPGWIKFAEHYFPKMLPHLSTCKSPQEMFGAMLKSYYCEKNGIDPKDLFVVSVIPCTAKKFEVTRDEMNKEVDVALTTREFARMIREASINFNTLEDEAFDSPFDIASGAGVIFGATGGVMEAALRTAASVLDGEFKAIDFTEVRGISGLKEATYEVAGMQFKVAVASGLKNARKLCEEVEAGTSPYQFIEVMACPGGCINGGGQPIQSDIVRNTQPVRELRAKALYDEDAALKIRRSHESPVIDTVYKEFFGEPGSEKAHHLLHTSYTERSVF